MFCKSCTRLIVCDCCFSHCHFRSGSFLPGILRDVFKGIFISLTQLWLVPYQFEFFSCFDYKISYFEECLKLVFISYVSIHLFLCTIVSKILMKMPRCAYILKMSIKMWFCFNRHTYIQFIQCNGNLFSFLTGAWWDCIIGQTSGPTALHYIWNVVFVIL